MKIALKNAIFSGVKNGVITSIATMLEPSGRREISGCASCE